MSQQPFSLVIGDSLLDRWLECEMTRVSPEAPVPVVLQKSMTESPGGAANVAVNIKSLGGAVYFASGVDIRSHAADVLRDQFRDTYGIAACWCPGERQSTPVKTRVTVGGQQVLRIDEERQVHGPEHTGNLILGIRALLDASSAVQLLVVSDYAKGCMTPVAVQYLKDVSAARPLPLFVDAKPSKIREWAGATLLKVNAKEAIQIATEDGCLHPGLSVADSAPEIAADHLRKTYGFGNVAVTCGAGGVAYWDGTNLGRVSTTPQRIYDVTGAGDVFLAAMAVGYLEGAPFLECLSRANVAAGLAVQRYGTTAVTRVEWEDAVLASRGWAGKIMGLDAAAAFVKRKRESGKIIVLANGCFDALHVGHIQTLAFARQQGDGLVAAYNDDTSLKALKGPDRPLIAEPFRAAQLAMLEAVDCVVRFDGDVEALVRKLHPDVLVKGAQNQGTRVPGADYIASRGGRVAFAPMIRRVSTTELNARGGGSPC